MVDREWAGREEGKGVERMVDSGQGVGKEGWMGGLGLGKVLTAMVLATVLGVGMVVTMGVSAVKVVMGLAVVRAVKVVMASEMVRAGALGWVVAVTVRLGRSVVGWMRFGRRLVKEVREVWAGKGRVSSREGGNVGLVKRAPSHPTRVGATNAGNPRRQCWAGMALSHGMDFGTQLRSGGAWLVRGAVRVRVREGRVVLAPPLGARERPVYRAEVAMVGVCLAEEGVARVWLWATGSTRRMGGGGWMTGAWGIGCPTGTPRSGLCGRRGVARVTGAMGGEAAMVVKEAPRELMWQGGRGAGAGEGNLPRRTKTHGMWQVGTPKPKPSFWRLGRQGLGITLPRPLLPLTALKLWRRWRRLRMGAPRIPLGSPLPHSLLARVGAGLRRLTREWQGKEDLLWRMVGALRHQMGDTGLGICLRGRIRSILMRWCLGLVGPMVGMGGIAVGTWRRQVKGRSGNHVSKAGGGL